MSSTYNAYTGTYTIKSGETRTMTFVRGNDLPSSMFEGKKRPKQTGQGHEVVFDVNAKGNLQRRLLWLFDVYTNRWIS